LNKLALKIGIPLLTGPSSFAQLQQRVRVLTDCLAFRLCTVAELLTRAGGLVGGTEMTQQLGTQCSKRFGRVGLVKVLDLISSATIEGCFQMLQLIQIGPPTINIRDDIEMIHILLGRRRTIITFQHILTVHNNDWWGN